MKNVGSHLRAIGYALIGFVCWTGADIFMKLAAELPVQKYEIMVVGGLGGMITIFILTALRGDLAKMRPRHLKGLVILAVTSLANYIFYLVSLPHMPLANFYTIIFAAPMVVSILATLFLHEPMTRHKSASIAAGFIGVVIAFNPTRLFDVSGGWIGYGGAFACMLIVAFQMLAMRVLGAHETRECLAFYPRLGAVAAGLAAMLLWGADPMPLKAFLYSLATGAAGGIGWLCLAQAYRLTHAATVVQFHYTQLVAGILLGYLIWHDAITWNLIAGSVIIVASGLYIAAHAHKTEKILEKQVL